MYSYNANIYYTAITLTFPHLFISSNSKSVGVMATQIRVKTVFIWTKT